MINRQCNVIRVVKFVFHFGIHCFSCSLPFTQCLQQLMLMLVDSGFSSTYNFQKQPNILSVKRQADSFCNSLGTDVQQSHAFLLIMHVHAQNLKSIANLKLHSHPLLYHSSVIAPPVHCGFPLDLIILWIPSVYCKIHNAYSGFFMAFFYIEISFFLVID